MCKLSSECKEAKSETNAETRAWNSANSGREIGTWSVFVWKTAMWYVCLLELCSLLYCLSVCVRVSIVYCCSYCFMFCCWIYYPPKSFSSEIIESKWLLIKLSITHTLSCPKVLQTRNKAEQLQEEHLWSQPLFQLPYLALQERPHLPGAPLPPTTISWPHLSRHFSSLSCGDLALAGHVPGPSFNLGS